MAGRSACEALWPDDHRSGPRPRAAVSLEDIVAKTNRRSNIGIGEERHERNGGHLATVERLISSRAVISLPDTDRRESVVNLRNEKHKFDCPVFGLKPPA